MLTGTTKITFTYGEFLTLPTVTDTLGIRALTIEDLRYQLSDDMAFQVLQHNAGSYSFVDINNGSLSNVLSRFGLATNVELIHSSTDFDIGIVSTDINELAVPANDPSVEVARGTAYRYDYKVPAYDLGSRTADVWFSGQFPLWHLGSSRAVQFLVLHEFGHAIGLNSDRYPDVDSTTIGGQGFDRTMMSYLVPGGAGVVAKDYALMSNFSDMPQTLMYDDIVNLGERYGYSTSTMRGNTTYMWDPNTQNLYTSEDGGSRSLMLDALGMNAFATIFDSGGEDTFDFSAWGTGVRIDLRPGEFSAFDIDAYGNSLDGGRTARFRTKDGEDVFASGNISTGPGLLRGSGGGASIESFIENAIGGSGNDFIVGNQRDNRLMGGLGSDTINGRDGHDHIYGGFDDAPDFLIGGSGNDVFFEVGAGDIVFGTDSNATGGGADTDIISYRTRSSSVDIAFNLSFGSSMSGGRVSAVIAGIGKIVGSSYNDVFTIPAMAVGLDGGNGIDTLRLDMSFDDFCRMEWRVTVLDKHLQFYTDKLRGFSFTAFEKFEFQDGARTYDEVYAATVKPNHGGRFTEVLHYKPLEYSENEQIIFQGRIASDAFGAGTSIINVNPLFGRATYQDGVVTVYHDAGKFQDAEDSSSYAARASLMFDWVVRHQVGEYSFISHHGEYEWYDLLLQDVYDDAPTEIVAVGGITEVPLKDIARGSSSTVLSLATDRSDLNDVVSYRLVGDANGLFAINLNNEVYLADMERVLDLPSYSIEVEAWDGIGAPIRKTFTFTNTSTPNPDQPPAPVTGGDGNDLLFGTDGRDHTTGGLGDDTIVSSMGADALDGGDGADWVDYTHSTAGINIRLDGTPGTGGHAEGDVLISIENVWGSHLDDTIVGPTGSNFLVGQGGNDYLDGGDNWDMYDGEVDTAVYGGTWWDYEFTYLDINGEVTDYENMHTIRVVDLRDGSPDGTDHVRNVEWFYFGGDATYLSHLETVNWAPEIWVYDWQSIEEPAEGGDPIVLASLDVYDRNTYYLDSVTWGLAAASTARFEIVDGNLQLKAGATPDYEEWFAALEPVFAANNPDELAFEDWVATYLTNDGYPYDPAIRGQAVDALKAIPGAAYVATIVATDSKGATTTIDYIVRMTLDAGGGEYDGNDTYYHEDGVAEQVWFLLGDGNDTIHFFEAGVDGQDTVLLDTRLASNFTQLMSMGVQEDGFYTFIFHDGSSLSFADLTAESFAQDDFVFIDLEEEAATNSVAVARADWSLV